MSRGRSNANAAENALTNVRGYLSQGQNRQALETIEAHCQRSLTSKDGSLRLDEHHSQLVDLAYRGSADLCISIRSVVKFVVMAVGDDVSKRRAREGLATYIDLCYEKTKKAQEEAATLASCQASSAFLRAEDRMKLINDSVVEPTVTFLFETIICVLSEIVASPARPSLLGIRTPKIDVFGDQFHCFIRRGYELAREFHRDEEHKRLSEKLGVYVTSVNAVEKIPEMIETQLVRATTAADMGMYSQALIAVSDANDKPLKPEAQRIKARIEEAKLDVLKKAGYKLYAAIQRFNLYNFYKDLSVKSTEELRAMASLALMETATAPVVEEADDSVTSEIIFAKFLNKATGEIPSRTELMKLLLADADRSAMTDFIRAAETGNDPFTVSECFLKVQAGFNDGTMDESLKSDMATYAALRTIECVNGHFNAITLDELNEMITWMSPMEVHSLLVFSLRHSLIPGLVEMRENAVNLTPHGVQALQPSHNQQLLHVFDALQKIKNDINAPKADLDENAAQVAYKDASLENRRDEIKRRRDVREKRGRKQREIEEQERRERENEIRRLEQQTRELEKQKNEERHAQTRLYNRYRTEIHLICRDLDCDVTAFLKEHDANAPAHDESRPPYECIDWIVYKANKIKEMYIKTTRDQAALDRTTRNVMKKEFGEHRISQRLAVRHAIMAKEDFWVKTFGRLFESHTDARLKMYDDEKGEYDQLRARVLKAKTAFEAKKASVTKTLSESPGRLGGDPVVESKPQTPSADTYKPTVSVEVSKPDAYAEPAAPVPVFSIGGAKQAVQTVAPPTASPGAYQFNPGATRPRVQQQEDNGPSGPPSTGYRELSSQPPSFQIGGNVQARPAPPAQPAARQAGTGYVPPHLRK